MVAPLAGFPNAGVLAALQYDRTMESQDPGLAGGLRSGETGPGGGSSGARCLPRSPHSLHPASALSGYGPLGEALSQRGPEGRGADFLDISVGKGCSQSGLPQLLRGREAGILPQPQILKETLDRR